MSCPTADLIESIKSLHSIFMPTVTISKRLHISEIKVRHVIEFRTLPAAGTGADAGCASI